MLLLLRCWQLLTPPISTLPAASTAMMQHLQRSASGTPRHATRWGQPRSSSSSALLATSQRVTNSSSSSSTRRSLLPSARPPSLTKPVPPATQPAPVEQQQPAKPLSAPGVQGGFLDDLSAEQQEAVLSTAQHVRVIAGPGSGKTRTVAARVAHLLSTGVQPHEVLVITFTRKAAEELRERLAGVLGAMPRGLTACTFHSLCCQLMQDFSPLRPFSVATKDQCESVVKDILRGQASDGIERTPSKRDDEMDDDEMDERDWHHHISSMKNFVTTTYSRYSSPLASNRRKGGAEMLAELVDVVKHPTFVKMGAPVKQQLVELYEQYHVALGQQRLVDFDDLQHHVLELMLSDPETIVARLHSRFKHILVDEGQDTNRVQFELVSRMTAPDANLYMVGDPDQAIYGFRGAVSSLLQDHFLALYTRTAATYTLAANYRSRPAIVHVADIVRGFARPSDAFVAGRSMRPPARAAAVSILSSESQFDESSQLVQHLKQWRARGVQWNEMAVLCRARFRLRQVYHKAVASGIPSQLVLGVEFWDSAEVRTALALLRCLVHPEAAGDSISTRLVKNSGLKVPLTTGLGAKPIDTLRAALQAQQGSSSSGSSSGSSGTLGSCLLQGCGLSSMDDSAAAAILQQWNHGYRGDGASMSAALEGLAPQWQQPQLPGLKALSKPQKAGLARLRGLMQLAAADAMSGRRSPADVMELLLFASGVKGALQRVADEGRQEESRKAKRRLANLATLVDMAARADLAESSDPFLAPYTGAADSSSSGAASAVVMLQGFANYCSLMGEGDGEEVQQSRVSFMTIHGSKGKEWPCVAVFSMVEGVLPNRDGDIDQERNTAYVACTRAKDNLLLTYYKHYLVKSEVSGRWMRGEGGGPSSFIREVLAAAQRGGVPGVEVVEQYDVRG